MVASKNAKKKQITETLSFIHISQSGLYLSYTHTYIQWWRQCNNFKRGTGYLEMQLTTCGRARLIFLFSLQLVLKSVTTVFYTFQIFSEGLFCNTTQSKAHRGIHTRDKFEN